ncbi:hypothetical protein FPY71_07265 [Aureimonas fodinaquatilis]|uniref:Fibronectin type-III domain-containing protein n=1 Tax=Aureimonas fodinaquatilis TaxID=2565783 RepID=A0A5B0DV39_9HYPH|nr:host specificity factor TipJ family phage tail protein [Aureimonas fodinaquatilis]KAA0970316.1 hypothetical protein FPY71_07265 [Aureimonas fodinaquatilis]
MTTLQRRKQELQGNVYGSGDTVKVVVASHPLRMDRVEIIMLAGLSVAEIAEQAAVETRISDLATAVVCYIDGHVVERTNWCRVRPKVGTTIVLRAVAEGPIFAGVGAIFSAISAATASVSAFIGGLGILGKVIGLGLAIGAQYLLSALFPVRQPQLDREVQEQGKQAFSISGSRNSVATWEAVPVVMGQHRMTPYYGAQPYTEAFGSDQFWRGLFAWCYGSATISDVRIGETPLHSFQDVQIEHAWGYPGEGELSLYNRQVIEEPLSIDLEQSLGWVSRTTATGVTEISADIVFPSGLYSMTLSDGRKHLRTVILEARYRNIHSLEWYSFPQMRVSERTVDPVRRTFVAYVPPGQYEVQIIRITTDDTATNNQDLQFVSKTILSAIRGARPTSPITFNRPLVRSAVRIRANQQLNGGLDSLNGIVSAHAVMGFNGTHWQAALPTRNPANWIRHALQGPMNARPVPNSQIDIPALEEFWRYCNAQGFNYDAVITSARSVFDMVAEIAAAGRAVPVFKDGRWSVVWDQAESPIVQQFTPRNSWGFESRREYIVMPHAFKVRFINREKGFIEDERIVYDDGYNATNATLFEGLEFPGVTDPQTVWRHARFHIAQLRLRPETISINADWENLICTRGDRVRIQSDVMLVGQVSGRITGNSPGFLHVDEVVTVEAGKRYTLRWRDSNMASFSVVLNDLPVGEYTRIPWATGFPAVGNLFSFGEAGIETAVFRVLSIETNTDLTARITLVDDAPAISLADRGTIPPFQSNVSRPPDPFLQPPTNIQTNQEAYQDGERWFARVRLSWDAPRMGRVQTFEIAMQDRSTSGEWRALGSAPASQTLYVIEGLEEGIYAFRVRAVFDNGTFSGWLTSEGISTTSLLEPPANVTSFNVSVLGDISTLAWNSVPNAAWYEIRFVPFGTEPVWNSATPLVPRASGTSAQVPTMVGSYLIKAVRGNGVRSRAATAIQTNVAGLIGLNVVEILTEAGWPGVLDRLEISSGNLRLLSKNVIGNWTALSDVPSMAVGVEGSGSNVQIEGYYAFAQVVDLGGIYTSRLTASIDAEGADLTNVIGNWSALSAVTLMDNSEPEDWGVELQFRTTNDSPSANEWSEWRPLVVGDVTARAFQFRLRLNGKAEMDNDYSTISPIVHGVTVSIDMPDRVDAAEDQLVPTAGRRVTFEPAFVALKGLAIAAQDMATGDRYAITNKDETGFFIRFFNSTNTAVPRTFDYVAKGYGNLLN